MKKLAIGLQTLEDLRRRNGIYVDKTEHIEKMVTEASKFYFLSRPRRFGKSLLISTLKELFKGNKEIFEGLYIYDKWDWSKKYPVIHLDLTEIEYETGEQLKVSLEKFLDDTATKESIRLEKTATRLINAKFAELIEKMHKVAGEQVVILIDEYDKPLIDNMSNKEVYDKVKRALHDFYQVIKASDEHIKFMFMTGVSRFAGLSIFSALNNLNDITMNSKYAGICGYTQEELESSFKEHIESTARSMGISKEELLREIKYWYNGYSWDGEERVYNPFSTLKFFDNKEFEGYWFETGTPTFLIEQIRKRDEIGRFTGSRKVEMESLRGEGDENIETTALQFQTGYLTIKKKEYVERTMWYTLDFPNYEVERAFINSLMKEYTFRSIEEIGEINKKIGKALKEKDVEGLEGSLGELYANIPYDLHIGEEKYYQSLFLLTMKLIGYEVEGEVHTDKGRADAILRKEEKVIVVEIKYSRDNKLEGKIEEAMDQIKERKYYEKYIRSKPTLLGIVFNGNKEIRCKFERVN